MSRWICSQIGSREHYAVPRVLRRDGKLERLYTDFWASAPWRVLGKMTGKGGLAARFHPELEGAPVTGFNLQSLRASRRKFANPYEGFLQAGRAFGRRVASDLAFRLPSSAFPLIFFGYDTGFLEPAGWMKAHGWKSVVCQMDPSRFEVDLVKEEEKRWAGWARHSVEVPEAYFERREAEWAIADLVVVNSEWTKAALMRQGVAEEKIVTVPLAYEANKVHGRRTRNKSYHSSLRLADAAVASPPLRPVSGFSQKQPLRVLFLGQVILRKGIQYLIESARFLEKEPIRFDVVGPVGISEEALKAAPPNVTFHGPVSRDRVMEFYGEADLFVLPTLSDGFALTQLEAMAHGLPVIATPNCGEVVTDGEDGWIVPAGDPMALAEAFQLMVQDPGKLPSMSGAAVKKSSLFGFDRLKRNLLDIEKCLNGRSF